MPRPKASTKAQVPPDKFRVIPLKVSANAPWLPLAPYKHEGAALQALDRGEATPEQQLCAMDYILYTLSDRNGMSYRPGGVEGARDSDFAEGRRFVGNQIVNILKTSLSKMKDKPK